MSLNDCVIATSLETVDASMSLGSVSVIGSMITQGGSQIAALSASWAPVTNPYVLGGQFEFAPTDGSAGKSTSNALVNAGVWTVTDGIVAGKSYTLRYRAAGVPGLFGAWVGPITVVAGAAAPPAPAQPGATAWAAVGTTVTNAGVSFPAIVVSGAVDTTGVSGIVVSYAPHGSGSFVPFGTYPLGTVSVTVDSVASGGIYDILIQYANGATLSPGRTLDNGGSGYTAGTFAASGAMTDVTPNAVNWTDQTASGSGTQTTTTNTQTITGINAPIVLTLTYTNTATWSYIKNGGTPTTFASGATLSVSVNDTLAFRCSNGSTVTSVLTIVNTTDSSTTLDTTTSTITVSGVDATPDAVNWNDITASTNSSPVLALTNVQTINSINVPITLEADYTGPGVVTFTLSVSVNGGAFTALNSGDTFVVHNGDTVQFRGAKTGANLGTCSGTVTVKNNTDGGAVLDTFAYSIALSATNYIPDPVDWNDIPHSHLIGSTNSQTITGITATTTLRCTLSSGAVDLFIVVNGVQTYAYSGDAFMVNAGDVVYFQVQTAVTGTTTGTGTVTNDSTGGTMIDTFAFDVWQ